MLIIRLFLLLALVFCHPALQAASKLEFTTIDPSGKSVAGPTIYLEGNKARFEQGGMVILFDNTQPQLTQLNSQQKQYMLMSPAIMAQQQEAIKARMEREMAQLTPEQRQQMDAAMQRQPGQVGELRQPQPLIFQMTGKPQQVNGVACQSATASREGKVVRDLCIAQAADLHLLPPAEYATLQGLLKLFHDIANASRAPGAGDVSPLATGDLAGIPVEVKQMVAGRAVSMTLKAVAPVTIAPEQFTVPGDYTLFKLPEAY